MAKGKILFFGQLSDLSGADEWPMPEFEGTMSEQEFIAKIADGHVELAQALQDPKNRICVNQTLFPPSVSVEITAGDEVAFLPPMSGG